MADLVGLAPVVVHYLMLDAPAGAALSALYMVIDITAVFDERSRHVRRLYPVHYVLAGLLAALTYGAPIDVLALLGTWAAIASRQQKGMRRLLALLVASTLGWGLYGLFAGSVGQVAFSAVYALAGSLGLRRITHQTHA